MTMVPPVRYALLRDGPLRDHPLRDHPAWACALPPSLRLCDDDTLKLAIGSNSATIESGRLDAGIDSDWERVSVEADEPEGGRVSIYAFTSGDPNVTPQWGDAEPSLNILLDRKPGPAPAQRATRRYLWLRIRLVSDSASTSPVLHQVQAQTAGRSYIEDLPAIYRRDDRSTRFLERWLALFRADMEGFEQALDDMPAMFDAQMARADRLAWVAQCLGFDPPEGLTPAQFRDLLQRVPTLYAQRGTVKGLEDWAEIYSGLRPKVIEAWRSRKVWQLDSNSTLGFDTMLAASAPDGLIVPGNPLTDPGGIGLLRQTFGGPAFEWVNGSPNIDRSLDFIQSPLALSPKDGSERPIHVATLRWTGQIKPRYAERYTMSLQLAGLDENGVVDPTSDVRVRFWLDGRPMVDAWQDAAVNTGTGGVEYQPVVTSETSLRFEELHWYSLRLEVRTTARKLKLSLSWASRSQRPEVVPSECLYALVDDSADTSRTRASGFDVGSAVVGESGPQTPDDYGPGLSGDTAHLFTVLVPPACDCGSKRHMRLRAAIDAEKPAHTDYHLCFLKPRMRVGFQARLGIDAIVADGPPPMRLGENALGRSTYLAPTPAQPMEQDPKKEASWTP